MSLLSMSTVREYGTVRRTFKYGTVRYGSFANTYLLDRAPGRAGQGNRKTIRIFGLRAAAAKIMR